MPVKNISKYHDLSVENLNKMGTRELVSALESSRGQNICSCGKGNHCGDDVLTAKERLWNDKQYDLYMNLKDILETREDVSRKEVPQKKEKKQMKY